MDTIERRTFGDSSIELRSSDGGKPSRLSGHGAVFSELSEPMFGFREQIAPGAFDGTLDDDVRILFNHDSNLILGRTASGTAKIGVDRSGLTYEVELPDTTVARDLMESVRRGDVNQSSFGFTIAHRGDEWDEDENGVLIRTITKVGRLFDQSPVTFPAYTQTDVSKRALELIMESRGVNKDAIIRAARARQEHFELVNKAAR